MFLIWNKSLWGQTKDTLISLSTSWHFYCEMLSNQLMKQCIIFLSLCKATKYIIQYVNFIWSFGSYISTYQKVIHSKYKKSQYDFQLVELFFLINFWVKDYSLLRTKLEKCQMIYNMSFRKFLWTFWMIDRTHSKV